MPIYKPSDHATWALQEIGRGGDTELKLLCNSVYIGDLYDTLNRVHGEQSLNCSRSEQTVYLTNVHDGTFPVSLQYRRTKAVRMIEPAANDALYHVRYRDYYVAQNLFPPNSARGIPQFWAWRRRGPSTNMISPGDTIELFPKPDRTLTLTHVYYSWLQPPVGASDVIMLQYGEMIRNYLCFRCLTKLGEHADAAVYRTYFERDLAAFAEWDDNLQSDEEFKVETIMRDGTEDIPLMG